MYNTVAIEIGFRFSGPRIYSAHRPSRISADMIDFPSRGSKIAVSEFDLSQVYWVILRSLTAVLAPREGKAIMSTLIRDGLCAEQIRPENRKPIS